MKFELEFHDTEILKCTVNGRQLEIILDAVLIVIDSSKGWLSTEDHRIPAKLSIDLDSTCVLPAPGLILDGKIQDIPELEPVGIVPIEFTYLGKCRIWLSMETGEFSIPGANIRITADKKAIPEHLRQHL